ncbi:MAG: GNAT family N-acetyltransferase [Burkholderiales bacterium]|nr:GNAT family N-acetyltransferase [Burkholderiales bacterium]
MTPAPRLTPLTEADFATVAQLGDTIWRAHYSKLISMAQIEYMLTGRYSPERLSAYVNASDRWLHILWLENRPVGYCSYSLTTQPGELKLEQLYLLPELHGRGLGRFMLDHVEAEARRLDCITIMLTVNKGNASSIAVYDRAGFTVRESAVFDIGNGYVMDDFVMEKRIA